MVSQNGHNGANGHDQWADTPLVDLPRYERMRIMRDKGWEIDTDAERKVRLRTVEPDMLLRAGDCPDILTPLLLQILYGEDRNQVIKDFLDRPLGTKEDAIAYVDLLNLICAKSICDGTKVEELELAEKRLIFRYALGSSSILVWNPRPPQPVVASVAQIDNVPSFAEPSAA